ncbi:MAG: DUF1285 domain-containing protein [Candidatus Pelagadaptatus aseana]|uniref:DUF1285 domain-containing protein n=1 Tax=Candidatus Pelagadaptatus aseana TaxID=3120508 RepID=UPI0039B20313
MESLIETASRLQQEFENKLPPVDQWNPELSGDLDMRIDREGRWYYQGSQIKRQSLVKMFSSILKYEGNDYYLVTPVEKWRIQVDIAPFTVIAANHKDGQLVLTTNIGNDIVVDDQHPIFVTQADDGQPLPIAIVQRGFQALIGRSVFYDLINNAETVVAADGTEQLMVKSGNCSFSLGSY